MLASAKALHEKELAELRDEKDALGDEFKKLQEQVRKLALIKPSNSHKVNPLLLCKCGDLLQLHFTFAILEFRSRYQLRGEKRRQTWI